MFDAQEVHFAFLSFANWIKNWLVFKKTQIQFWEDSHASDVQIKTEDIMEHN